MDVPMSDPLYEYFFSFRTLEDLSSCHRPVLEPHLLWYATADNFLERRQELFEMKAVREGLAQSVFEELPDLLPPESNVQPVFEFIRESKESPIASGFHGPESVLAAQTGYAVGQLESNRIGEVPPVGLVMLTECLRELVPLLRPQFPAGTRLHMYAAYLMDRMGLCDN
jgi:hypothetical protein